MAAPSIETLSPERRSRFLHYNRIYKEFIQPALPTCKVYHHEPVNALGGVTASGWSVMEYAAPDRTKGWAVLARIGPTPSDTYCFRPRGIDPGKKYRLRFDRLDAQASIDGLRWTGEGVPIRLEGIGSSELLLWESRRE